MAECRQRTRCRTRRARERAAAGGAHRPSGSVAAAFMEEMTSFTARSRRPASKAPSRDCDSRSESCVHTMSRLANTGELAGA